MLKEVTMYSVECDVCEKTYIDDLHGYSAVGDPDTISEMALDSGWYVEKAAVGQRCYCPKCLAKMNESPTPEI